MATKFRAPKLNIKGVDSNGDKMFSRSSGARSGGIRWSNGLDNIKHNLDGIDIATVEQIGEKMKTHASGILHDARTKVYAKEKWVDNSEGKTWAHSHPSARWPSRQNAAEGLFVFMVRRKTFLEIALSHSHRTIYIDNKGRIFDYGIMLETGWQGKFAVVEPTLRGHSRDVMDAASNTLTESMARVKRFGNGGGTGQIASGWYAPKKPS